MADAGEIKARVTVEYDGSGIEQAKKDLASLSDIGGNLEGNLGGANDALQRLQEQADNFAGSAKNLASNMDELQKPLERGGTAVSEMNKVLQESPSAIEDTATAFEALREPVGETTALLENAVPPMQAIAERSQVLQDRLSPVSAGFVQVQESLSQTIPLLPQFADSLHTVSESFDPKAFGLDVFEENMAVFQDALVNPEPFNLIQSYLNETGQAWQDFFSSIGDENVGRLSEVMSFATPAETQQFMEHYNSMFGGTSAPTESIDELQRLGDTIWETNDAAKSANETIATLDSSTKGAGSSAQGFAEQLSSTSKAASETAVNFGSMTEEANKAIQAGTASAVFYGEKGGVLKPQSFGEAFGNATQGLMGALNDIAMPLMAVQMIAMAVQATGQAIYDSAAIAEGPAAHSFGTFTGTVDALGQSIQRVGGQFSESFGQGIMPTLNALNYQVSQPSGGPGLLGGGLGMALGTLFNLAEIGTGFNPIGGFQGLVNTYDQIMGMPPTFQGPPPAQQSAIKYQQQFAQLPQTITDLNYQTQSQADLLMGMATNPQALQTQAYYQRAQQVYQRALQSYEISHPVSEAKMLDDFQYAQYVATQGPIIAAAQQNAQPVPITPSTFTDYWGNFFGGLGDAITHIGAPGSISALSTLFGGGGGGPRSSAFDSLFGGNGSGAGGFGNWLSGIGGGISGFFSNLFGGGGAGGGADFIGGGCFVAGTRVLMADGTEKPIEVLQVGERVLAHDGKQRIHATITDRITFAAKQTYRLVFSNGTTLFTTDSHPIATIQGWKSVSPESTKLENPDLPVTPLEIGDSIYTADGSTCRLVSLQPDAIVPVFNITVNAAHTYYANHILVHNAKAAFSPAVSTQANVGGGPGGQFQWPPMPEIKWPSLPEIKWPSLPEIHWPSLPEIKWPSLPEIKWPSLPEIKWPSLPEIKWPSLPEIHWPSLPEIHWPSLPQITWPSLPQISWPSLPQITWPALPQIQWPSLPQIQWPALPQISWPSLPTFSWPSLPEFHFPSLPEFHWPSLPSFQWPALPQFSWPPMPQLSLSLPVGLPFFASGVENFGGGPAIVGEGASMEAVAYNGQYAMFDKATLVNLPPGSSVYPMQSLSAYPFSNPAGQGGGGGISPISLGGGGGGNVPQSINVVVQLDSQQIISAIGLPFAQTVRAMSGMRSY